MPRKQFCVARFYDAQSNANVKAFGWLGELQLAEWARGLKTSVRLEDHSLEQSHLNLKSKVLRRTDLILLDTFGAFDEFNNAFEVASERYAYALRLPDDAPMWGARTQGKQMNLKQEVIERLQIESNAAQATGCAGAGDAYKWAKENGWSHCRAANLSSSAGDWLFIVSEDGEYWYLLSQTNNYPRPGFSFSVDETQEYFGTAEEVLEENEF